MLISIAWKNIWRKPTRSIILISAIIIGLAGGIFSIALTEGMIEQRNKDEINLNYTHLQIHTPAFLNNMKITDTIPNAKILIEKLSKNDTVKAVAGRLKFMGMAATAHATRGVMIYAINPKMEKNIISLNKNLLDSNSCFLDKGFDNEILISSRMAQNLKIVYYVFSKKIANELNKIKIDEKITNKLSPIENIRIRSKKSFKDSLKKYLSTNNFDKYADIIVNKSTQFRLGKKIILKFTSPNGDIIDDAFRVTGIYKTNDARYDNMNVFVKKTYIANLVGISKNASTEIIMKLKNIKNTPAFKKSLQKKYKNLKIQSYKDLDPFMLSKGKYIQLYYYIMIAFILFALSFGIINTVLMSVMERTKELGMLMAIGMKKKKIFSLIMLESVFISLTGGFLGMALGALVSMYFGNHGINMAAYSGAWESYGFNAIIYPVLESKFFVSTTILVIITGILSALYPAKKALKLNPSEALRSDV
jgi:ABC-type lipoprotein release transport system permease subunit